MLLATLCILGFILLKKGIINKDKIKKSAIIIVAVFVLSGISLTICGYFTCYNVYTPESKLENPDSTVEELFPYHNISKGINADIEVSHNLFADHIGLYCNGISGSGEIMVYRVDYFESLSPLLNVTYTTSKTAKTPFSDPFDIDVEAPGKSLSINGKEVTTYVDGGDYAVLISDFNRTIYASITGRTENITETEFAEDVLKQFELLEDVVDSEKFLDAD